MADLDVERKGPSIWPWIIALVVLALLIWALVELFEEDRTVVTDPLMEQPPSVEVRPEIGPAAPDTTRPGEVVLPGDTSEARVPAGERERDTLPEPPAA